MTTGHSKAPVNLLRNQRKPDTALLSPIPSFDPERHCARQADGCMPGMQGS